MAAARRDSELATMSVRRQLQVMGAARADDLISTMMGDHEQAQQGVGHCRGNPRPCQAPMPTASSHASPPQSFPGPPRSLPGPTQSLPAGRTPSGDPDNPVTSLVSRLWRSKTVTEDIVMRPVALAIKQTHWLPMDKASKCAGPTCRKLFTSMLVKRRNCAMCGNVFCRNCTNYTRRLSSYAKPDPLGQFNTVCQACFNFLDVFGCIRDHIREFHSFRKHRVDQMSGNDQAQGKFSLCSRRSTEAKKAVVRREAERLVNGFRDNPGKLKGLVSEVVVPEWQKCSDWVPSKNALACLNCGGGFGVVKRKLHCRIGGQVFCSKCASDELILYHDEDADGCVKWALNGKDGGPTKVPAKFRMLVVCRNCSAELQEILMDSLTALPPSIFLDNLSQLHSQLSRLQAKVEADLPVYRQLVEAMDCSDCSPKQVEDRHPMRKLTKAHSDLSDAFSGLALESQRLKALKPKSHLQEKLLRNVMMGMYCSYSDNMYSFRNLKNHLSELVPMETLGMIQASLSQQSMDRVHVVIQQVIYEALNLEHQYKFDNVFFTPIVAISNRMDEEFKEFVEGRGESWEEHNQAVQKFIEIEMSSRQHRIKINRVMLHHRQPRVIHYLVVSQCSSLIHECFRELQAKTVDREFKMVKESLYEAIEKLDTILRNLNAIGV